MTHNVKVLGMWAWQTKKILCCQRKSIHVLLPILLKMYPQSPKNKKDSLGFSGVIWSKLASSAAKAKKRLFWCVGASTCPRPARRLVKWELRHSPSTIKALCPPHNPGLVRMWAGGRGRRIFFSYQPPFGEPSEWKAVFMKRPHTVGFVWSLRMSTALKYELHIREGGNSSDRHFFGEDWNRLSRVASHINSDTVGMELSEMEKSVETTKLHLTLQDLE